MTIDEPIEEKGVKDLLKGVLIEENLQNAQIEFVHSSKVGDGYLGVTTALEVKSDNKILKLFIKAAPKDKKLRQALLVRVFFTKEIHLYDEIIPTFDDFLQERIGKSLNLTPKCYATNLEEGKEVLVFENLKEHAFTLFDRKKLLDEQHILLVLRAYAKFHGVSYSLKDQCPDVFSKLTEDMPETQLENWKNFEFHNNLKDGAAILRKHLDGKIDITYLDKLDRVAETFYDISEESIAFENDHKVILHGDCWMNNMMFKYQDGGTVPTEIKLLDFQLNRVCLPVFDLSFFFYCSACTEENLAKLDYYLEYYHNNLIEFIKQLGSDGDRIYPYSTFRDHWRKFCRIGLLLAIGISKTALSEDEEIPNVAKMVSLGQNHGGAFNIKLTNPDVYVERMKHILLHFVNNKFI